MTTGMELSMNMMKLNIYIKQRHISVWISLNTIYALTRGFVFVHTKEQLLKHFPPPSKSIKHCASLFECFDL